jgi:hypothetical protein
MKTILAYIGHIAFVLLVVGIVYQNSTVIFNMPDLCELTQTVIREIIE